jgi:hypothetical protein
MSANAGNFGKAARLDRSAMAKDDFFEGRAGSCSFPSRMEKETDVGFSVGSADATRALLEVFWWLSKPFSSGARAVDSIDDDTRLFRFLGTFFGSGGGGEKCLGGFGTRARLDVETMLLFAKLSSSADGSRTASTSTLMSANSSSSGRVGLERMTAVGLTASRPAGVASNCVDSAVVGATGAAFGARATRGAGEATGVLEAVLRFFVGRATGSRLPPSSSMTVARSEARPRPGRTAVFGGGEGDFAFIAGCKTASRRRPCRSRRGASGNLTPL